MRVRSESFGPHSCLCVSERDETGRDGSRRFETERVFCLFVSERGETVRDGSEKICLCVNERCETRYDETVRSVSIRGEDPYIKWQSLYSLLPSCCGRGEGKGKKRKVEIEKRERRNGKGKTRE